jgi:hypothetical protein
MVKEPQSSSSPPLVLSMEILPTFLCLPGELLLEVVKEVSVEVLTAQMGVTSGGLDGEDTTLNVKKGNIESTTTEIVDEDVPLLLGLSGAKTVGDSGGGRLVDDTENVETGNGTGVLGGLTLVVVEVGGDGDDGLLDLLAELGLSNLLHLLWALVNTSRLDLREAYLNEDHGGDLLGGELLGLAQVLDLDHGRVASGNNLEGP